MAIKHIKNGHRECVIVFSAYQVNNKSTNFTFFKNMIPYTNKYDFIFLLDETSRWYNYKFDGVKNNSVVEIQKELIELTKEYKSVTMLGASMGGYASILYSLMDNVNTIVAIAPQTFLKPNWPRYEQSNLQNKSIKDLRGKASNYIKNKTLFNIVIGMDDLFDIYQAYTFFDNSNDFLNHVTLIPGSFHNVALFYHKKDILERFFEMILNKRMMVGMSPYKNFYDNNSDKVRLLKSKKFQLLLTQYYKTNNLPNDIDTKYKKRNIAYELYKLNPSWLGLKRIYGLSLFEVKEYELAFDILKEVSNSVHIDDIYLQLCKSSFYLNRHEELLIFLKKIYKMNKGAYGEVKNKILELYDTKLNFYKKNKDLVLNI